MTNGRVPCLGTIARLHLRISKLGLKGAPELVREIGAEADRTIQQYSHLVVDEATKPHLRLTSSVLASYHALTQTPLPQSQLVDLLEDVFGSIGRASLRLYTQALMMFSKDPFSAITRAGKKRAQEQYGAAWRFEFEEIDASFTMTTTKCFYQDFFVAAGTPQLTRVFCSWDQNWTEPVKAAKHGVAFERLTTMGLGGTECPFVFTRTKSRAQ